MPVPSSVPDHWSQVQDLDGEGHYRALNLQRNATQEDIKKAYRDCARRYHPDKGGDAETFAKVQTAFETLSDPKRRAVYDEWAKEIQYRYIPGVSGKAQGGEDVLLDEFEGLGLHCEARTQLVVLCEVCWRPSTKECWTCGMKICDFCTLKRHWKDAFPLHWPLINSDHMRVRLAKKELEQKRIEDAERLMLLDPNSRTQHQLSVIRAFKDAAHKMQGQKDSMATYDLSLARFYMWAQTFDKVFIAVLVPTGYQDMQLVVECSEAEFRIQSEKSPPVVHRQMDYNIDRTEPIESFRTEDNRYVALILIKAVPGEHWRRLFRGDPDGARCLQTPYRISEGEDDVLLEISLPFWIFPEDVSIQILEDGLHVSVRNELSLHRTYWKNRQELEKGKQWQAVDTEESMWCLEDDLDGSGENVKTLMISLVRPPLTEDEITWKKGKRQDNRAQDRPGSMQKKGYRFFADDEDEFQLEELLEAVCFMEGGTTWVPRKPWEFDVSSKWVDELKQLPKPVQMKVEQLTQQKAA